jgi:rhamnogalacturonyl hydrolase YesR
LLSILLSKKQAKFWPKKHIPMRRNILITFYCLPFSVLFAQSNLLSDFPKGYTPEEVGKRIAYRFVDAKHALHAGKWISYPETFYWRGALLFASMTNDKELFGLLQNKFDLLLSEEKELLPIKNHVDLNMFGCLPLEFYRITKEKHYLELGLPYADSQWKVPDNANPDEKKWAKKGYSWQTRLWIDDMYMITIVQTQAYKATGDPKYINRAAKEMVLYLKDLQRPNGLFFHAPDVPYYWLRGNGWVAAGMTELLRCLPRNHKDRSLIMQGYQTMMESLKNIKPPVACGTN